MIALRAARLFDGHDVVEIPIVVLDGSSIVSVGVEPPDGVEVVDLGDATLLPGFVDSHQHLVFNCAMSSLEEMVAGLSDDELRERARANALSALRAGVTTIRDLGDRDYVTLALRNDPALPTLLCSGPPITVPQGHCWYLGGETDPADVADAVNERVDRGCNVIKVMASGGHGTPGYPMSKSQFSTDDLRRIVETAHARGVRVTTHCHGRESIVSSIDAGLDSIEHCTFMNEENVAEPDLAIFQRMVDSGIALSATIGMTPAADPPPIIKANVAAIIEANGAFVRMGGLLSAGTDAGIGPGKPHNVFPYALTHLLEMGVSRTDALRVLTANGAEVIGLADRKGRLAPGYDADVVAIAGNPLAEGDLTDPVGVWLRGSRVV